MGPAFSPLNPFQVGVAQKLAQLPALSGGAYRMALLVPALVLCTATTMRHAAHFRRVPSAADTTADAVAAEQGPGAGRHGLVLLLVFGVFGLFTCGVVRLNWNFDQMSALFLALSIGAELLGGLGLSGTADGFVAGFRDMAFSAMLVGFARAIFVVLEQGHIVDTLAQALATPLAHLPVAAAALGMMGAQTALHLPVPSVSGQATLTVPLLVPLADLIGLLRQVVVLAFQYAAGLCKLITPTNGALMVMLATCGVGFDEWLRFAGTHYPALLALGAAGVVAAIYLGGYSVGSASQRV